MDARVAQWIERWTPKSLDIGVIQRSSVRPRSRVFELSLSLSLSLFSLSLACLSCLALFFLVFFI